MYRPTEAPSFYDEFGSNKANYRRIAVRARKFGDRKFARMVEAFASAEKREIDTRMENVRRAKERGGQWKEMLDLVDKEIDTSFSWDDPDSCRAFAKTIPGPAARRGFLAQIRTMEKARDAFNRAYDHAEEKAAAAGQCPLCGGII